MRDQARERERRRQARIEALKQGLALKDFNFNDENVLLSFGMKPTRVFSAEKLIEEEAESPRPRLNRRADAAESQTPNPLG